MRGIGRAEGPRSWRRGALDALSTNLSRIHALVCEESATTLLVYDLASTNGVRAIGQTSGPSLAVARLRADESCMLGHFELYWYPGGAPPDSRTERKHRA